MGFQVHIQLLCFISNYFCKNLVSLKVKSYKEAIVAFWKKLSVLAFATQKKSCLGLSISTMQDREHYTTISPPTLSIKFIHSNLNIRYLHAEIENCVPCSKVYIYLPVALRMRTSTHPLAHAYVDVVGGSGGSR